MAPVIVESSGHARKVVVACILLPIFSTVFVVIRVVTRQLAVGHSLSWDDYAAIITLLSCIAFSILMGLSTTPDMTSDLHRYVQWIDIADLTYLVSLLGYKAAILLLYLRLFSINSIFKYLTWATFFLVFGYLFSNFLTQIFGCSPSAKYWNPELGGHCINYAVAGHVYGAMNLASDFLVFILPLPMIWQMNLSLKEKVGVSVIFMAGALTCAVAVVRYVFIVQHSAADAAIFICSILEINTGLVCSCAPMLKPFFYHVVPKLNSQCSKGCFCGLFPGGARTNVDSLAELGRYPNIPEGNKGNTLPSNDRPKLGAKKGSYWLSVIEVLRVKQIVANE